MAISTPTHPSPLLGVQQCMVLDVPCPTIDSDMSMNSASLFCQKNLWSQTTTQYEVFRDPPSHGAHCRARICQHGLPLGSCEPI